MPWACGIPPEKLASASLMPGTRERRKLRGKKPFYYVFDFKGMLPGATANDRISVVTDFWLTQYTVGSVGQNEVNATSFVLNLFETRAKQRFMSLPLLQQVQSPLFAPAPAVGFDATFGGTRANSPLATPAHAARLFRFVQPAFFSPENYEDRAQFRAADADQGSAHLHLAGGRLPGGVRGLH